MRYQPCPPNICEGRRRVGSNGLIFYRDGPRLALFVHKLLERLIGERAGYYRKHDSFLGVAPESL